MSPRVLLHITSAAAWRAAEPTGSYRAPSLETEGFIHLSLERQWLKTAERFYKGQAGLVLLVVDATRLTAAVRFEPADGDEFPHLYGDLPVTAVVAALPLALAADGTVLAPPALPAAIDQI